MKKKDKGLDKFEEKYYIEGSDPAGMVRKKENGEPISLLSIPDEELPEAFRVIKNVMRIMGY